MSVIEFHKIWIEQCEAAEGIKEEFGTEKALGYLLGEKLLNFIEASDTHPKFAQELPNFIVRIKEMFQPWEISEYLNTVKRVGSLGHICKDEEYDTLRDAGAIDDDVVHGAEEIILIERAKELLLA